MSRVEKGGIGNVKRILLVDDDQDILNINSILLKREGFQCITATKAEQAYNLVELEKPDLIVLDILLTDGSGIDICHIIRHLTIAPIIFLTSLLDDRTKIEALEIGGDDYITKPYKLTELLVRIQANLRRVQMHEAIIYEFPPLKIDVSTYRVFLYDQEIYLTQKEMQVLIILVSHHGTTVRTEELHQKIWGDGPIRDSNVKALHVHISTLRKKLMLGEISEIYIQTVRHIGYCFQYIAKHSRQLKD